MCIGAVEELLQLARTVRPATAAVAAAAGGTADGTGDERFGGGTDRRRGFVLFLAKLSLPAPTFLPRHVQKYQHFWCYGVLVVTNSDEVAFAMPFVMPTSQVWNTEPAECAGMRIDEWYCSYDASKILKAYRSIPIHMQIGMRKWGSKIEVLPRFLRCQQNPPLLKFSSHSSKAFQQCLTKWSSHTLSHMISSLSGKHWF